MWPVIILAVIGLTFWQRDNIKQAIGLNMTTKELIRAYYPLTVQHGTANGIEPTLILAVIKQESNGNPKAQGPTGDFGLMQITQPALTDYNNANHTSLFINDLLTPEINIKVGSWYLSNLFRNTGNWKMAVRAYNVGLGNIKTKLNAGVSYADSVFNHENTIKNEMWSV